jgi:1-phosphofructokinase
MIVTITPSPAIDWTVEVASFEFGAVNRTVRSSREASGKGVNISWALHRAGVPTRAVFPAGGDGGRFMAGVMDREGLDHVVVDTGVEVRTNITLITPDSSTKINEWGPALPSELLARLRASAVAASRGADAALVCGSLPTGAPPEYARDLARDLAAVVPEVVVDTSGEPLRLALDAMPALVKPNVHELADLVGRPIATLGEVVGAAQAARGLGARAVLASLGADGALLVDGEGALYARADGIPFVNSVGAGDALLAGFVGGGPSRRDRLATALLWASSAVAHNTTLFPIRREFAERIAVVELTAPDQPLSEPSAPLVKPAG